MAHYHHEKWDSSGYLKGLKGGEIPLCARIMAIADVYDVLRSRRSCKEEFLLDRARMIIEKGVGTHFGPEGVEAFLENIWAIEAAEQGIYRKGERKFLKFLRRFLCINHRNDCKQCGRM